MKRFAIGDMAIYARPHRSESEQFRGTVITVIAQDVFTGDVTEPFADYGCIGFPIIDRGAAMDFELDPLDPPAEPESLTRREEIEA